MKEYIFLLGNNIDRKFLVDVKKKISKDKDIRKLIRYSRRLIFIEIVLLLCSLTPILVEMIKNLNLDFILEYIRDYGGEEFIKLLMNCISVVFSFTFLIAFYNFIKNIQEVRQEGLKFFKYIQYLLSPSAPRVPSELWSFFSGSVMDAQIISAFQSMLTFKNINRESIKIKTMYAGKPYYTSYYIDSIYIKWNCSNDWFEKIKIKRRYKKFLKEFSFKTYIQTEDKTAFKDENQRIGYSNCVFGMYFSSQYLKKELETQGKVVRQLARPKTDDEKYRICIKISDKEKSEIANEWMRYSTDPSSFTISSSADEINNNSIIEVVDINYFPQKERKLKHRLVDQFTKWRCQRGSIRIPIKKIIVFPNENNEMGQNYYFPYSKKSYDNNIVYVCLGGAEQNLALQHLILTYQWNYESSEKSLFGLAENEFETLNNNLFMMGCENFVYGFRNTRMNRDNMVSDDTPIEKHSNYATIYELNLKSVKNRFYGIYGFSAMATKIAALYFLYNLIEQKDIIEKLSQMHVCECQIVTNEETDRALPLTTVGKDWDKMDMINNIEYLIEWFKSSACPLKFNL